MPTADFKATTTETVSHSPPSITEAVSVGCPGEVLLLEFLEPMELSQSRLAKYFKVSPDFWLGLQMDFDLDTEIDRLGDRLESEVGYYVRGSSNG